MSMLFFQQISRLFRHKLLCDRRVFVISDKLWGVRLSDICSSSDFSRVGDTEAEPYSPPTKTLKCFDRTLPWPPVAATVPPPKLHAPRRKSSRSLSRHGTWAESLSAAGSVT